MDTLERWIARQEIDTKLHKKPRAMNGNKSNIMDEVLEDAYKRDVGCLKTDPSQYVQTGIGSTACSPAEPVIFYIYLAVFFEMKTYVQDYPGVILRRDWQTVKFYNATVDREKDNFVEFKGDECKLRLNSNTKTNPDGSQPRKEFSITGTRLAHVLKLWDRHAYAMQNQTIHTRKQDYSVSSPSAYVVCHYTCKQAKTFGRPYNKPGDFYNNVKKVYSSATHSLSRSKNASA
jgi:hypothetical protein